MITVICLLTTMNELNDYRHMLDCLLVKEQSYQMPMPPHQHLNGKDNCTSLLPRLRRKICDWYYEFVDHFNFDREVVGVAMNYFDRYTSINADSLDDKHNILDTYQTLAATALFLAIKLYATRTLHRNQALSKIIYVYGHANQKGIYEMEMSILRCLDWCVNPPTLHQFAFMFYKFHPLRDVCSELGSYIYEATCYQVELAIFMPELLANFKPSVIVYAAIKNAEEKISADNPHILTADMKQSLEALMPSHSGVVVDPTAVTQCQMLLKRVCPELPDLDYYVMTDTLCCNKTIRTDSNSPTNVVDFRIASRE